MGFFAPEEKKDKDGKPYFEYSKLDILRTGNFYIKGIAA